ncbi:MAG: methionine--tRNA ligase [Acidobacteriaceae bacterium]
MSQGKFYLTTPIYYVNARPHIGHAYTTIACDAVARRQRMLGKDVFFLTGTDEHGQKIERSAAAAGKTPQQFADEVSQEFRKLWERMGITYDKFIRTTDDEHKRGVQQMFRALQQNGHIYKGTYTGQYCTYDELYVDSVGPGEPCPECGRPTETVSEENYYFKLSAMQAPLLAYFEQHPGFIQPEARRNEVIAFVRSGLRDLSITRSSFSWGIPVPDDPKHVIYVWLDALCNYLTAVGYGAPADDAIGNALKRFWPADLHMIGKEIVRFHCVYWPAFLLAAEVSLPRQIIAHGWILFEESKMSKSRGNVVRTETILDVLDSDALRYFLLREIVFGQDGSFSFDALVQRFNSDLANDYGNAVSRTLQMMTRYFKGEVPYPSSGLAKRPADEVVHKAAEAAIAQFAQQFDAYHFSRALETAWSVVAVVNRYLVENEPWALADKTGEEDRARLATILYTSAEALRIVTALVHPVLPDATAKIWAQFGLKNIARFDINSLRWGQLELGAKLGEIKPIFPRADKTAIERMQSLEQQRIKAAISTEAEIVTEAAANPSAEKATLEQTAAPLQPQHVTQAVGAAPAMETVAGTNAAEKISIDDFAKVELRVAQITVAEKVKGADKLLRLEVDLGYEQRQIVAGIAKAYDPESLIGRKVVIVANLAPRKLRGLESNGMIVAASLGEEGRPVLAGFLEDVEIGARLK